jgi:hypothetical protein
MSDGMLFSAIVFLCLIGWILIIGYLFLIKSDAVYYEGEV